MKYAQFVRKTNRPDPDSCITVSASATFIATNGIGILPGFPQTGRDPSLCELGRCAGLCGLAERQDRACLPLTNGG